MQVGTHLQGARTPLEKALSLPEPVMTREVGEAASGASGLRAPSEAGEAREASRFADRVEISDEARALQRADIQRLRARDAEVRAHENAHAGAGGAAAGAPSLQYQTGPDGKRYAVGGEVPIRLQEGGTPAETIRNASQVRAAALAPAQPSSADVAVAAAATAMEMQARIELASELRRESTGEIDAAQGREAAGPDAVVGEGGSFDTRVRDYGRPPAAALEPGVDLFG